ncbi:alpha/beta hydrolase [Dethiosulfatarculus sandiegensis]|uniref:alpha/beta hydrolase n=1 Tax=Dethiosulfatarculus sandiegensis TaxID=1429043 RepID=UPI0009E6B02B|nr:alpha/beta hydrolase [Dethiosulfatarculus sandiegensis]
MAHKIESFEIAHDSLSLAARLHRPSKKPQIAVVVSHGLKSSMASRKLTNLCRACADFGFLTLQFDHSGCGDSPGEERLVTLTQRRDEVLSAAKALSDLEPELPLAYMGSSLGGAAVIAASAIRPPVCTIAWSAPTDMKALMEKISKQDPPPDLPLMVEDIPKHDLKGIIKKLPGLLFIHGQLDEVVPVDQTESGYECAPDPRAFLILTGADHQLSKPEDQRQATAHTLAWLEKFANNRKTGS